MPHALPHAAALCLLDPSTNPQSASPHAFLASWTLLHVLKWSSHLGWITPSHRTMWQLGCLRFTQIEVKVTSQLVIRIRHLCCSLPEERLYLAFSSRTSAARLTGSYRQISMGVYKFFSLPIVLALLLGNRLQYTCGSKHFQIRSVTAVQHILLPIPDLTCDYAAMRRSQPGYPFCSP